ncbi:MAG: DUF2085 domain-containing protein [Leptolinea sp.]
MITVTLFRKNECEECEEVLGILKEIQELHPHRLAVVNVDAMEGGDQFDAKIKYPYIKTGPYVIHHPFNKMDLQVAIGASTDRASHLESIGDQSYQKRIERGRKVTGTDRFSFWLSKYLMLMISFFIFLYAGLPFLAPVLMKANIVAPAKVIYAIYSPLCHQLAFRSWFLFGEQPFYPRSLAGVAGFKTFEEVTGIPATEIFEAREFVGNEQIGFKVALCERDTAIYGSMFFFGIIFMVTGKRLKTIPWYLWIVFGLIPIGLDGFSQLPGLSSGLLPAWVPLRESTPLLRVITGALFGGSTAWYLFPLIEESMRETRHFLAAKMVIADQLSSEDGNQG